jgi:hypothetical protein
MISPTTPVVPHCQLFLRLKKCSVYTQGYADYTCLMAVDKFLKTQGSYRGPFTLLKYGVLRLACQLALTR